MLGVGREIGRAHIVWFVHNMAILYFRCLLQVVWESLALPENSNEVKNW